jgi:membrane protease YdiL (CAAX protease family)
VMQLGWVVLSALVALALLRRAPPVPGRRGLALSAAAGLVVGIVSGVVGMSSGAAGVLRGDGATGAMLSGAPLSVLVGVALSLLAEEVIFRGVLQRALEQDLVSPTVSVRRARVAAAVVTGALAIVALAMTTAPLTRLTIALQLAATLTRAVTGRVSAAWLARLAGVTVCAFL